MRDDESDDEADFRDDRGPDDLPSFPGIVRAAGIIWIGVGALGLINTVLALAMAGAQGPGGPAPGCCGGAIALAFLVCGYQTVTGKAADTRGNGIGSIVLGLLQVLIAAAIGFGGLLAGGNAGGRGNAPPPEVLIVTAVLVAVMGMTLIAAGVFALLGRTRYREWRKAQSPRSRCRPRPRDEEDEEGE